MSQLDRIRACVFDAYGTVFDFSSVVMGSPDIPEDRRAALVTLWRDKQLQYTWLRSLQGRYVSFWQVTGDALDFALETLNLTGEADRDRLMDLWRTPPAFPEVPDVLRDLRERGFLTAILSNGSREMLDAAVAGASLAGLLDAVLSVDDVRVFKTHPNVYQHAVDTLGVPSASIAFQSSNAWDAMAASDFGMQVVWCNRYGQRRERLPGRPDHEIPTLADLPGLLPSVAHVPK
jgi:2-haloacid dehalogenase